jgi:uncharacterized protein (TIGR01777 family)
MVILISGGTGLIGTELTRLLLKEGHSVRHLSRSSSSKGEIPTFEWNPSAGYIDETALEGVECIVHLAGAGIADSRWTDRRKKTIIDSRVKTAHLLLEKVKKTGPPLKSFISASGISYYGLVTNEKIYVEHDPAADEFIGKCCVLWEEAADQFGELARVVKLRTGIVLAKNGGALEKIAQPVKIGAGAPLGSGNQWVPYIHIHDLCRMYLSVIEEAKYVGVYNAVNGDHITNEELTKAVAQRLKKPLWLPNVPGFALKLVFGEMANLILKGSRVSSDKVRSEGFKFQFEKLDETLKAIYH